MNAALVPALLARRYFAASVAPVVCARLLYAHAVLFQLAVLQIPLVVPISIFGRAALSFLLPFFERKHVVLAPGVPGLAYAAVLLARSVSVYRLRANGAFPVSVAVHFPVSARLKPAILELLLVCSAVLSLLLLPAERKHGALVPAAWALVCFAVCAFPHGYEDLLCAGAGIVDSGAVNLPAAEPLARHDNFAAVPVQVSAVLLSLLAECRHGVLAPAALVLVCVAVRVLLNGYEDLPCAGVGIAESGAVNLPAAKPLAQRNNSAAVLVTQSVMSPLLLTLAERRHVAPVPVALASVCCAV